MGHIANFRYVVQGNRDDDGRRWAIFATDDRTDAERVMLEGVVVNDRHWTATNIHDRRTAIMPRGGWSR